MPVHKVEALKQIDAVLERKKSAGSSRTGAHEVMTLVAATVRRLAPPGSAYPSMIDKMLSDPIKAKPYASQEWIMADSLLGVLHALRADYDADRLQSFQELVHADLFSDFLETAEYFLDEGFKDPAAVMAGGVLEEHLRKLCAKHGIPLAARPKLDTMNADLARASAYGKNDQKQVTAWADIRNDAAHGNYTKYTDAQVKLMTQGIRDFISRNPA